MSKLKLLGIAVAGLIVMNIGLLAFLFFAKPPQPADSHPESRPPFGPPPQEVKYIIIERLHFDNEQVAAYEELVQQHRTMISETDREIRDTKNKLYATLSDGNKGAADSLQNRLALLHRKIEDTHYSHFEAIKKLCKPGQMDSFNTLTKDLAGFFGPGRNGPPPPR